jgi:hypothetical protein
MTTSESPFTRKDAAPDKLILKQVLGAVHPSYKEVLLLIEFCEQEWKFYGARHGWQLKVSKKGKALLYLIPLDKSFRLGFAVRDLEKRVLLKLKLPAKVKEELESAKRYPEGYPLKLLVKKESDMKAVRLIVNTLKELRE